MTESTDLIAKKAAYAGLEAAITLHIERAEELAIKARDLQAEIDEIEGRPPVMVA